MIFYFKWLVECLVGWFACLYLTILAYVHRSRLNIEVVELNIDYNLKFSLFKCERCFVLFFVFYSNAV